MQRARWFVPTVLLLVFLSPVRADAQLEPVVEEVCATLGCEDFCPSPVPAGTIVMWSGSLDTIPPDWALCDGTNGTPDLRDRFVMGVSDSGDPGATGGSVDHLHSSTAHGHSLLPTSSHSHSVSTMGGTSSAGGHVHTTGQASNVVSSISGGTFAAAANHTHTMTSAGEHAHGFSISTQTSASTTGGFTDQAAALTDPAAHLPPYFTLAFIMKLP